MTTSGGPQDAVPQDSVPGRRANKRPWPPPPPRARRAVGRLVGVHALLVLAFVVFYFALSTRAPACDGSYVCFSPGEAALFAFYLGCFATALLCPVGAVAIGLLRRRVRRTGTRVLVGQTAEVAVVVLLHAAGLTRMFWS